MLELRSEWKRLYKEKFLINVFWEEEKRGGLMLFQLSAGSWVWLRTTIPTFLMERLTGQWTIKAGI